MELSTESTGGPAGKGIEMSLGKSGIGNFLVAGILMGAMLVLFGTGFLFSGPRQAVDWSGIKAVAIESDDWGLPGFSPSLSVWDGVDKQALAAGAFPEVYWGSTLEDSLTISRLCEILSRHKGQDGLPAVFQPNYVMGSLEWRPGSGNGRWLEHSFPDFPTLYQRPGLMDAVWAGIGSGLWYPELHARWHYDPEMRRQQAVSTRLAKTVTSRGVMLFPGSEKARELGPWRQYEELSRELEQSRSIFASVFGRSVGSIIAPDYTWNSSVEKLWSAQGIKVIQAKREQRNPDLGHGKIARLRKYLLRKFDLRFHPDRKYLERNCRLEPVQATNPQVVVDRCVADTRLAWKTGQPAVIESHRVNFAHLDQGVVDQGLNALDSYLNQICNDSGQLPAFLTDIEVAQLQVRGCSWVRRGEYLIFRNGTHSARVISVPIDSFSRESQEFAPQGGKHLVLLPALRTVIVLSDGQTKSFPFNR